MKMLMIGTAAMLAAVGFAEASASQGARPVYATSLPACFSPSSPILPSHYGYDDRKCAPMSEIRAAFEENQSAGSQIPHPASALPNCLSKTSPILDLHYGYDDRDCSSS